MEVVKTRILLRLNPDADPVELASIIGGMDANVEVVDTVAEQLEAARGNIFLKGPRQVQELGVPFAALVSSVGVALVVSTTMGERRKEITLMTIRGFSSKQLIQMLAVENVSIIAFSILLGGVVGYITALGDVALANTAGQLILSHVVFPITSIIFITAIAAAILLSAVVPIVVASRRSVEDLSWRIME
jgi:predicted lysophospholipase L1 biosynthesis ABC-type transport system permease subunit